MENATDALIMAGSVLLLLIALTVGISSLSNLKMQVEDIVSEREGLRLTTTTNQTTGEREYLNYIKNGDDVRTVGVETIMSSYRRMRKEDYDIYIVLKNEMIDKIPDVLKTKMTKDQKYTNPNGTEITIATSGKEVIKLSMAGAGNKYMDEDITKSDYKTVHDFVEALYNGLKDKKFKEYIGVYQDKTAEGVSQANKQTHKIITFVQTN